MTTFRRWIGSVLFLGLFLVGPIAFPHSVLAGPKEDDSEVLALVNGEEVTLDDLSEELANLRAGIAPGRKPQLPSADAIMRRLIQNRLLEQEGRRIGADSTDTIRNQVREMILHKAVLALLDSVSAQVSRPGEEIVDSLMDVTGTMNRISHILVPEEEFAIALRESLALGVSFDTLAGRYSVDSVTARRGGDLGWAREGAYVPEFEEVVRDLSPGSAGGPVQTDFGWHLILLSDTREETFGRSEKMKEAVSEAILGETVRQAIRGYVEGLREKYGVVVNDSLLASLDYASDDPDHQEYLRSSDEILVETVVGKLTVRGLTRTLLFKYFHGLQGRPGAATIRDTMFDEYLAEALLRYEARERGFTERAEILEGADRLERRLLREEVLKLVLDFPFEPEEEQITEFYSRNLDRFTPDPKIKVQTALLASEEEARGFRRGLEEGAKLKWLAARSDGVEAVNPGRFSGWLDGRLLGVDGRNAKGGDLVGPVPAEEGWVVAVISSVEDADPTPLSECRATVVREMKSRRSQEVVGGALARLEEAAEIEVLPGADSLINISLLEWKTREGFSVEPSGGSSATNSGR